MRLSDLTLVLGSTMRLTRLIVADDLGQWWVKDPLTRWVHADPGQRLASQRDDLIARGVDPAELEVPLHSVPSRKYLDKYLDGLDCPFCVGFWIGAGVLASYALAGHTRPWRFVASALTLNEAAAHLGARLGDTAD